MQFKKNNRSFVVIIACSVLTAVLTTIVLFAFIYDSKEVVKQISEEDRVLIIKKHQHDFSQEEFMRELLRLNIKYPHIVMAQAMQESSFKSPMFNHNNNMLGMKVARRRPSTNIGEQFNHANYDNWRDAVVDYALWQCTFILDVKTEDEYYQVLDGVYAESTTYISKVRPAAEKWKPEFEKLKEKIKNEIGE